MFSNAFGFALCRRGAKSCKNRVALSFALIPDAWATALMNVAGLFVPRATTGGLGAEGAAAGAGARVGAGVGNFCGWALGAAGCGETGAGVTSTASLLPLTAWPGWTPPGVSDAGAGGAGAVTGAVASDDGVGTPACGSTI